MNYKGPSADAIQEQRPVNVLPGGNRLPKRSPDLHSGCGAGELTRAGSLCQPGCCCAFLLHPCPFSSLFSNLSHLHSRKGNIVAALFLHDSNLFHASTSLRRSAAQNAPA